VSAYFSFFVTFVLGSNISGVFLKRFFDFAFLAHDITLQFSFFFLPRPFPLGKDVANKLQLSGQGSGSGSGNA
jgi:hypothetical protein